MDDLLARLPPIFAAVHYDGSQTADGDHDLGRGANCQRYAYAVLAQFGIHLPPFRSSELWADCEASRRVETYAPLDLLLFSPNDDAFGAHVAVYAGAGQALHLARSVGVPVQWPLSAFAGIPAYRVLIGGKRAKQG